ncbi:hypothetical protein BaRGS_00024535, partial [Batillaria attramentaria]
MTAVEESPVLIPSEGSGSTCAAPTVEAGATASVTCTFDTDVSGLQFMVRRKRSDGVETVLDCYQLGDKPRCDMSSGVRYDLKPGKVQTLYIVNVRKHFAGNYICETETTSEDECKPCHLNVSAEPAKSLVDNIQAPTEMSDKPQHSTSRAPDVKTLSQFLWRKQQKRKHEEKGKMKDDGGSEEDKVP